MSRLRAPDARTQFRAGLALAVVLALPPLRGALETGMSTHMLVQFPALLVAGAAMHAPFARPGVSRWNALGIAGLLWVAAVLGVSMIPRLLDLALVDLRVEAAKWLALLVAGAALRASWSRAGIVVQGFFLGNVLPMTAVVGTLYRDAPLRICNSYRLDEQQFVGTMLVALAIGAAIVWLVSVGVRMHRAEARAAADSPYCG